MTAPIFYYNSFEMSIVCSEVFPNYFITDYFLFKNLLRSFASLEDDEEIYSVILVYLSCSDVKTSAISDIVINAWGSVS